MTQLTGALTPGSRSERLISAHSPPEAQSLPPVATAPQSLSQLHSSMEDEGVWRTLSNRFLVSKLARAWAGCALSLGMARPGAWKNHQILEVPKKTKTVDFGELLEISATTPELGKQQRV